MIVEIQKMMSPYGNWPILCLSGETIRSVCACVWSVNVLFIGELLTMLIYCWPLKQWFKRRC